MSMNGFDLKVFGLDDGSELIFFDVKFNNIDSIGDPFQIMILYSGHDDILDNKITIGIGGEPLKVKIKIITIPTVGLKQFQHRL